MKRLEVTIRGTVQGVNFRNGTGQEARRLGLVGEVWNAPGGSVGIVVEGPEEKLKELLAWSAAGPAGAEVAERDFRWAIPTGEFSDFVVRR